MGYYEIDAFVILNSPNFVWLKLKEVFLKAEEV